MRRSALLLAPLLALLLASASCASSTSGSPIPSGTGGEPTSGPSLPPPLPPGTGGTSERPSQGAGPLAATDPCTLLGSAAEAQLGVSGGKPDDKGTSRGCTWQLRGPQDTYFLTVGIRDKAGLGELPNDSRHTKLPDVGAHQAVQSAGGAGPGSCGVILGVTASSRVEASVIAGTDEQKACGLAMQLASLVEPKLPKG